MKILIKHIIKIITIVLLLIFSLSISGGYIVKAFEFDYEFNLDDEDLKLIKTFTGDKVKFEAPIRYQDDIIYYSYQNFPNGSGANQYGYEVAVNDKGFIIELATRVSMPKNGFVISAHGDKTTSIKSEVKLGDIVIVNKSKNEISFYRHNLYSSLASSYVSYQNAIDKFEEAKTQLHDIKTVEIIEKINQILLKLDEIKAYNKNEKLSIMEVVKINSLSNSIRVLEGQIVYMCLPFRKVEAVAMWHRPTVGILTYHGVISFLNEVQKAGINLILVETLWNSYPVYPSKLAETYPLMVINGEHVFGEYGNDYLACFIAEAHKRNIEVHAWTQTLRGGTTYNNNINDVPAHLDKSWIQKDYHGNLGFDGPMMYLDPANPDVLKHLKAIYTEIINQYDWDGIEVDYIRYPYTTINNYLSNSDTSNLIDGGYTEYAMTDFLSLIGKTGSDLRQLIKTNATVRRQWCDYRINKVTNVVKELTKLIKDINPELEISMAVAADYEGGTKYYMQNWMSWIKEGLIDTFRPMAYMGDIQAIADYTIKYTNLANNLSFLEMGIGSGYEGYPPLVNQLQMEAVMNNNAIGSAIFASQNIYNQPQAMEAMQLHTNRFEKVAPYEHFGLVLEESMNYLVDKMERIYEKEPNTDNLNNLKQIIINIKGILIKSASDYAYALDCLKNLRDNNKLTTNKIVKARIDDDVNYLINLLEIKINRALINYGYWDGKGTRPDISEFSFPELKKITNSNDDIKIEDGGCFGCGGNELISISSGLIVIVSLGFSALKRKYE